MILFFGNLLKFVFMDVMLFFVVSSFRFVVDFLIAFAFSYESILNFFGIDVIFNL